MKEPQYTWKGLMNLVHSYHKQVLELPQDNSIFSTKARVAVHKRRLIIMQQIHRHFLEVSRDPTEVITQTEEEKLFIDALKDIFQSAHLNIWSSCEAKQMGFLISDVLTRCQVSSSIVFGFISTAFSAINKFDAKTTCGSELLSSLIISNCLFQSFSKQASSFSAQTFKQCVLILNSAHKDGYKEEFQNQCVQLILSIAGQDDDRFNVADRSAVVSKIIEFMRSGERKNSIIAAKIYSKLLSKKSLEKKHVKTILELLNGRLSLFLYEERECFNLLECCFNFAESNVALSFEAFLENIIRIQKHPFIDTRLFAECLASVTVKQSLQDHDLVSLLSAFIGNNNSKTAVKPVHPNVIESFIFHYTTSQPSSSATKHVFSTILNFFSTTALVNHPQYSVKFLTCFRRIVLHRSSYFDFSLFANFPALKSQDEAIQSAAIALILSLFEQRPVQLCNQIAVTFGQLKGDYLRISQMDNNVDEVAVVGLLKLFSSLVRVMFTSFRQYADDDLFGAIYKWIKSQLNSSAVAQLSLSSQKRLYFACTALVIEEGLPQLIEDSTRIDFLAIFTEDECLQLLSLVQCGSVLVYGSAFVASNLSLFEAAIKDIDSRSMVDLCGLKNLYQLLYIIGLNLLQQKPQPSQLVNIVSVLTKIFATLPFNVVEDSAQYPNIISFIDVASMYCKMFWRGTDELRLNCTNFWTRQIQEQKGCQKYQVLLVLKSLLEEKSGDVSEKLFFTFQTLCQAFLGTEEFSAQVNVGLCLGSLVNLLSGADLEHIKLLSNQIFKYALAPSSTSSKSRIIYLVGLGKLNGLLRLNCVPGSEVVPQTLFGLLSSTSRQCKDYETKAAVLISLANYVNTCGATLNPAFYCELCELLLEHVFLLPFSWLIADALRDCLKSLALFAKVMDNSSIMAFTLIRALIDTDFLKATSSSFLNNLLELHSLNPESVVYPRLSLLQITSSVDQRTLNLFTHLCSRIMEVDQSCSKYIIYDGIFQAVIKLLRQCPRNYTYCGAISHFFDLVVRQTIKQFTDYWISCVLPTLFASAEESNSSFQLSTTDDEDVASKSAFSFSDLRKALQAENHLCYLSSSLIFQTFARNSDVLSEIGAENLKKTFPILFKLFASIVSECFDDRVLVLSCLQFVKHIIPLLSGFGDLSAKFDNQLIAIMHGCLKARDDSNRDPYIAAFAFDCCFGLLTAREDLRDDLFCGKSRFSRVLKEASNCLASVVDWRRASVFNFEVLSVILGLMQVQRAGLDISCLGNDTNDTLRSQLLKLFDSIIKDEIDASILESLNPESRLIIAEAALKLNSSVQFDQLQKLFRTSQLSSKHLKLLLSVPHDTSQLVKLFRNLSLQEDGIDCLTEMVSSEPTTIEAVAQAVMSARPNVMLSNFSFGLKFVELALRLNQAAHFDNHDLFSLTENFMNQSLIRFEESMSKPLIVMLRNIISSSNEENFIKQSNALLRSLISKVRNLLVDSFVMQLVTFGICSRPSIWDFETLEAFKSLFSFENTESGQSEFIQILVENWILLLKATSKGGTSEDFEHMAKSISRIMEEKLATLDMAAKEFTALLAIAQDLCIKMGEKSGVLEAILHE